MEKPRFIFLIYHGTGHFHACFQLARALEEQYTVVFAGLSIFKNVVENQRFKFYPLSTVPFGMGFEKWVNQQKGQKFLYFSVLKDRWKNRLFHERTTELNRMLTELNPGHILIDSMQSSDFIVLYPALQRHGIRYGFIQTMISTIVQEHCPPLTSNALPSNKKETRRVLRNFTLQRFKDRMKGKLLFLGKDNVAIVRQAIRKNKIPKIFLSKHRSPFSTVFNLIPEFILSLPEFDIPENKIANHQHHLGFLTDTSRNAAASQDYWNRSGEIWNLLKEENRNLIYCSFGTVSVNDSTRISLFIKKLIYVISKTRDVLVISFNQQLDIELPENVFMFTSVPQLGLLEKAKVFISHGGLNAIKEAVHAGVPLLVFPVDSRTDQPGNAMRVVFHGLGLQGNLVHDTPSEIQNKINRLMNNPSFPERLNALRFQDKNYLPSQAVELLLSKIK